MTNALRRMKSVWYRKRCEPGRGAARATTPQSRAASVPACVGVLGPAGCAREHGARWSKRVAGKVLMKRSETLRFAYAFAIAISIASTPGSWASWAVRADAHVGRFDGNWVGEMQTIFSSGPCGRTYRLEMTITGSAASGSASRPGERFALYGEVSEEGAISWSATSGRGSASGTGMLEGTAAHGHWEDSTGSCAGTFSFERTP